MNISERGLDLIKEFEDYLEELDDGRCTTYICPAGKLTIGWGCTKGIKPGDIWTREQAEAALRRELAECEAAVIRMVTVVINQHQFDALVSFAYNCGIGALQKSSILRRLNSGNYAGAADAFAMWNKAKKGGRGRPVEMRGLTRRRAAEKALFLTPPPEEAEPEHMPQSVAEPPAVSPGAAAVGGTGLIGGGALLADPAGVTSTAVAVKANAGQLLSGVDLVTWGVPLVIAVAVLAFLYWSRKNG